MSYHVVIANSAKRDLRRLSSDLQRRIAARLEALKSTSRPAGASKLRNREGQWRIRVGDYRIIYQIDEDKRLVIILRIKHRREAYR
ncbi:MAG: type II toxin-antitoxin system RelE/ParE family toxin [Anaerolineae bacterium]